MSEFPIDANGNPIYPPGMIEAHTAFLAHFSADTLGGLQERVKRGLAAALPLLKKAWEAERVNLDKADDVRVPFINHEQAMRFALAQPGSNVSRCYVDLRRRLDVAATKIHMHAAGDATVEKLADAYLQQEERADNASQARSIAERDHNVAFTTLRELREILGVSSTATVQDAARACAEQTARYHDELDEIMEALKEATSDLVEGDEDSPEEPTWQRRLQWLVKQADPYKALADKLWPKPSGDAVAVLLHKLATEDWHLQSERKCVARGALMLYQAERVAQPEQGQHAATRILAVVESFAKHAEDSGWTATASELRRKAVEAAYGPNTVDNEVVRLQARLADLTQLYRKYQDAVDLVFQGGGKAQALLPDFLAAGDNKSDGIVRLARAYIKERENVKTLRSAIQSGPSLRDRSEMPEWKHRLNTALAETAR